MPRRFVHGTTYYHFANPPEELAENFRKMRAMGMDTVRVAEIWPGWEVLEPEPARFDFQLLDDYVEKAVAAGLNVVMGIGINNPPFWIFHNLPDVRCVDVSGRVATRRVQSANHDHPAFRGIMKRFIEKQVTRYADRPGIVAWQFGNEMRYGVPIADNECTRVRFREWLRWKFHGDLDRLNRRWGVHYRSWAEIYPYCSPAGAPTQGLSPLAIATLEFQAWSIEDLMRWGAAIVRKHSSLPVFHNNYNISGNSGSHWRLAAAADIVAQDIYPTTAGDPQVYSGFLLDCAASIARSLKKPLWIGETSVGQYGTYKRDRAPQALVEALVMEMLGCGIEGLLYFRHKAPKYEQPHKFTGSQSAFRRDGSAMEYARTPERVSRVVERLGDRLLSARPVAPQVGIYYPEESARFAPIAGYDDIQRESCFGASRLWNRLGVPVHILPTEPLLREDLGALKVIYLPVSYLLPRSVGERLAEYVRSGGTLIAECRPGYVDEEGWLYEDQPGAGLAEVFAAREDLFWNTGSASVSWRVDGAEGRAAFPSVCQTFRVEGGEAMAWNDDKEVMGVLNLFGRGTGVLLGVAPSLLFPASGAKYGGGKSAGGAEHDRAAVTDLIGGLARRAGVASPLGSARLPSTLSIRVLASERETLLFLCNHGEETDAPLPSGFRVLALGGPEGPSFDPEPGPLRLVKYGWAICAAPTAGATA